MKLELHIILPRDFTLRIEQVQPAISEEDLHVMVRTLARAARIAKRLRALDAQTPPRANQTE